MHGHRPNQHDTRFGLEIISRLISWSRWSAKAADVSCAVERETPRSVGLPSLTRTITNSNRKAIDTTILFIIYYQHTINQILFKLLPYYLLCIGITANALVSTKSLANVYIPTKGVYWKAVFYTFKFYCEIPLLQGHFETSQFWLTRRPVNKRVMCQRNCDICVNECLLISLRVSKRWSFLYFLIIIIRDCDTRLRLVALT